jgi:hypothetical protein
MLPPIAMYKWPVRVWFRTGGINAEGSPLYASRDVTPEDRKRRKALDDAYVIRRTK